MIIDHRWMNTMVRVERTGRTARRESVSGADYSVICVLIVIRMRVFS